MVLHTLGSAFAVKLKKMFHQPSKVYKYLNNLGQCIHVSSINSILLSQKLEESIKSVINTKTYGKIPDLLESSKESFQNPNPFSFFSSFPYNHKIQIIDEILQSFISIRPRSRPQVTYSCLLSYTLQTPNPLPISLAILQRTLRSGCIPIPQTHLFLSSAWLTRRSQFSVSHILMEMESIGYRPDSGTCNYLISSLCAVDELVEAIEVLKGMSKAKCAPNLETYGTIIHTTCEIGKTIDALNLMKEMVVKVRLTPRQGTVIKVVGALRSNKEIWKAVELIEFLEKEGFLIGFETYELVVEGCLEIREFVLAGKVVMKMTGRGFIPYIEVRHKVFEGLVRVGEYELSCIVYQIGNQHVHGYFFL